MSMKIIVIGAYVSYVCVKQDKDKERPYFYRVITID